MTHGRSFLHSEYLLQPSLTFRCPHNSSYGTPWQTPPLQSTPFAPSPAPPCGAVGGGLCLPRAPARAVCWFSPGCENGFRRAVGERGSGPPAAPLVTRTGDPRGGHGVRGSSSAAPIVRGLCAGCSPPTPRGVLPEQRGAQKCTETSGCVVGPPPPDTVLERILTAGGVQFFHHLAMRPHL